MDFEEHINLKIVEVQEKYQNLKNEFNQHIKNLNSSRYQLNIIGKELEAFISQVIQNLNNIPQENHQAKLELLANSINQIKDFIDDKPSVIGFEIDKYVAMISLLEDFNGSGELLKNSFEEEKKKLDRINSELASGKNTKDLTKRKKVGRRVEKIRDVRKAQSRSKKKATNKKRSKKSGSK